MTPSLRISARPTNRERPPQSRLVLVELRRMIDTRAGIALSFLIVLSAIAGAVRVMGFAPLLRPRT